MHYFPFNRELVSKYVSAEGNLTITGLFITEVINNGINEEGELDPDYVDEIANPQLLKPDFLMRDRLDELNEEAFRLLTQNAWSHDEVLYGLKVVRNYLWNYWNQFIYPEPGEKGSDFYTGSQAKELGPKSYKKWRNCSDPLFPIFSLKEKDKKWIKSYVWSDKKPSSWLDIYALISLWCVDESISYLNSNDFFKANVWNERSAILNVMFAYEASGSFIRTGKKGGQNKAKGNDPLKERVREFAEQLKSTGKWKSVRNTAFTIAPEIIEMSKKLERTMSVQQAPLTIRDWLNEMGYRKKV